jgi:flagellar hook capping protein FlgD
LVGRGGLSLLSVALSLVATPQLAISQWRVDGAPVCVAANIQRYPQAVSDGAGGVVAVWFDYRSGTSWDIYCQHVLASGVVAPPWTATGTLLCDAAGNQTYPQIVSDGAGGAIVTWQDWRSGSSYDIYAQHVLASGDVDPAWTANGTLICGAANDQTYPLIVSDGAGGAIITWPDRRTGSSSDIYAQHVLSSGSVDPAWATNGTLLCDAANNQFVSTILSDGAAGAFVTWYDYRAGHYDIYSQHVLASGAPDPDWTANGTPVCTVAGDQVNPRMISDGAGGAIIAWQDRRNGSSSDVYAHRLLATGAVDPTWTLNGTLVCDAAGNQDYPQIVSDDAEGAIVTWQDYRNLTSFDSYAQHVLASGTVDPAWTTNGTLLCGAAGDQDYPQMVSDGVGGAIVTWCDGRGANSDLYAQHVLTSGTVDPAWTTDGTLLCSAAGNQDYPVLVPDGAGGAIVIWFDYRDGSGSDIYAQRIYGGGGVAAAPLEKVARFAAPTAHPNPAHGGTTISFDLAIAGPVTVTVYDAAGKRVRTLVPEQELPSGRKVVSWDGTSNGGTPAGAGIYFVRVTVGSVSVASRLAILR